MFGRVPIVTDFSNTTPPANSTRAQVYAFVETELTASLATLPVAGPQDGPLYGRVTSMWHRQYWLNYTLMQKYIQEQLSGDKCIAACDAIINSTKYALSPNYSDILTGQYRES